jgi:hypothetical protein
MYISNYVPQGSDVVEEHKDLCSSAWLMYIRIHLMFIDLTDVHKLCTSVLKLRNIFLYMNISSKEHKKSRETNVFFVWCMPNKWIVEAPVWHGGSCSFAISYYLSQCLAKKAHITTSLLFSSPSTRLPPHSASYSSCPPPPNKPWPLAPQLPHMPQGPPMPHVLRHRLPY